MSCLAALKNRVFRENVDRNWCSEDQRHQIPSGGIPLARKICYAVGGVPYQITAVAIGVSMQIFLLDVVQMEASYVSMVLFASRAWDAVTDPLIGYLVSRSKQTPIGKLVPWLVLSTPFAVMSYLLLWLEPQGSTSVPLSVLWFLTVTCLFETLMSCYNVPYLSLNMFLGGDRRDRNSATAYRMSVEMAAMLLASIIQGQVVAVYNTEKQEACQRPDQNHEAPQSTSAPQAASLRETQKAFLIAGLVMGALFFLCSLVLFFGVKEHKAPVCSDDAVRPSYLNSLKMLICHIPYQRLVLGFVCSTLAFQMCWSNFALFCSHAAGLGAHFQYLLLALLASASIAVPLWQAVLLRVGKKTTVFIGLSLFIPAVLIIACVPSTLPVSVLMCILMGFSVASVFLLPWSMLPDVVDDFAVKHPSCTDLEPLFFSCYAFCNKLAGGLSAGISTMILHFVGYRAGACRHGDEVVTALVVLFSPVPIALLLIAMVFFCSYPINERHPEQLTTVQPETTSSPSQKREKVEQQTLLWWPHPGVRSSSQNNTNINTNINTSYESHSSPCCCCGGGPRRAVKSSSPSDVRTHSAEHAGCESVLQSDGRPRCHRQRPDDQTLSRRDGLDRRLSENEPELFSTRTGMRSKVSWV